MNDRNKLKQNLSVMKLKLALTIDCVSNFSSQAESVLNWKSSVDKVTPQITKIS